MRPGRTAKKERQVAALERQVERDKLTSAQQIQKLVKLGHGHCREVKRLQEKEK